jgi:hypothetical protein
MGTLKNGPIPETQPLFVLISQRCFVLSIAHSLVIQDYSDPDLTFIVDNMSSQLLPETDLSQIPARVRNKQDGVLVSRSDMLGQTQRYLATATWQPLIGCTGLALKHKASLPDMFFRARPFDPFPLYASFHIPLEYCEIHTNHSSA